ncbi:hypothetical protein [Deinococcus misasensis]|uniref:hypothetical protein n=1 Tax=Deinococcus misasensis TaxID=392413 RepID=UPI000690D52F|nr:hypothetical protein [Deinococcus misasensis]
MNTLVIGQRIPLKELTSSMEIGFEVQIHAAGLKHHLMVKQEGSVVPAGTFTHGGMQGKHEIQLDHLSPDARISVVIELPTGLKNLSTGQVVLLAHGKPVAGFQISGRNFTTEKTATLAEIYFKNGWRCGVLCQGYSGLLASVLQAQGGVLAPVQSPVSPSAVSGEKLNLSKLTLEKQGASGTIELSKHSVVHPININLKWSGQGRSSWFGLRTESPDLDLGCMVEMQNGDSLVIQALGGYFGSRTSHPYILLDKDDRSGNSADGENLTIHQPAQMRRMLVYAFIYEGASTFADVNAKVTLTDQFGNEIVIPLNQARSERFCALALIQKEGSNIRITKEERYFQGHRPCDHHYNFGFSWTVGRKD